MSILSLLLGNLYYIISAIIIIIIIIIIIVIIIKYSLYEISDINIFRELLISYLFILQLLIGSAY